MDTWCASVHRLRSVFRLSSAHFDAFERADGGLSPKALEKETAALAKSAVLPPSLPYRLGFRRDKAGTSRLLFRNSERVRAYDGHHRNCASSCGAMAAFLAHYGADGRRHSPWGAGSIHNSLSFPGGMQANQQRRHFVTCNLFLRHDRLPADRLDSAPAQGIGRSK